MNPTEYIKAAQRTCTNNFHTSIVSCDTLIETLRSVAGKAQHLDVIKKAIFYGKSPSALFYFPKPETSVNQYSRTVHAIHQESGEQILHGVVGIATEAGELVENILEAMMGLKTLDKVNLKEEIGDLLWYVAIICYFAGLTFEEIMDLNIAKLKDRYPEKFTEELAVNRDLEKERKTLEGGAWE